MISGFVCDCHGFMSDDHDLSEGSNKSFEFFEAGINRDGWFKNVDLVKQLENTLALMKRLHPDCEIVLAFDNSMNHHARAPDGLDASLLNLSDGGANKREIIRDGWYERDGTRIPHKMHTDEGVQKGVKTILTERGKNLNTRNLPMNLLCQPCKSNITDADRATNIANGSDERCCARYTLSQEPDFLEQEEWLTEKVKQAGHRIIFFPKFHCELNFIEAVWGWMKSYHRRNCTYNYGKLKAGLPKTMLQELPLSSVRKYSRSCFRFMSGYRLGLEGPLLDYAMKRYTGHRRIPEGIQAAIEADFVRRQAQRTGLRVDEAVVI